MARRLVSQSELGAILGLSTRQIRNLEQAGLPKEARGYPIPHAVRWYVEYKVAEVEDRLRAEENEADERLKGIRASLLELELEQKRGRLMTIEQFDNAVEPAYQRVRAKLMTLPARLAPAVVGVATVQQALAVIQPLVREMLEELRRADDVPTPGADDPHEDAA